MDGKPATTSGPNASITTPAERDDQFVGILEHPPAPLRYDDPPMGPEEAHGLLSNWVPEGAAVLDVGAGSGTLADMITRERNARVTCIEPDVPRAELARARGLSVFTGTVQDFAATTHERFDIAVLADVIEHLSYPAPILTTVRGLLAPGGHLLVSVPNAAHWTIREALLRGRWDYDVTGLMDATHLRWYTLDSLTRLLTACGFVVEGHAGALGGQHPAYSTRYPWIALPERARWGILRRLVRFFPTAFAQQHILRARVADRPAAA
jgi:methionine biosynthesis protein MetW